MAAGVQVAGKLIGVVQLSGCRCRCGHEWLPRDGERPRVCPKCKSPNWDRPKLFERKPKEKAEARQA
jgi:predicted Zn-ribbon and HTH transcriptional regulator